jgi:exodeoxyribonuclease VII large subunit
MPEDRPEPLKIYSVTSLTQALRDLIAGSGKFDDIWVEGEISDLKVYTSGHAYFTLKDGGAIVKCVVWSQIFDLISDLLKIGDRVVLRGNVDVYTEKGAYQLYVSDAKPKGRGELYARFEELKARLKTEGLFDQKRPLPRFPRRIGVVTSPEGAVLHDLIEGIDRRFPCVEVVLAPSSVQGEGAAKEIARAISSLSSPERKVDVIIAARGGGSIEDLWAFNEEVVARALFASSVPTVSAVGHETDFTISDFVADLRAGTPSKAAELVVPDKAELLREIEGYVSTLYGRAADAHVTAGGRFELMLDMLRTPESILAGREQTVMELTDALVVNADARLKQVGSEVAVCEGTLSGSDPDTALARGYAIVRKGDKFVSSVNEMDQGDSVSVVMRDGDSQMKVERIRKGGRNAG